MTVLNLCILKLKKVGSRNRNPLETINTSGNIKEIKRPPSFLRRMVE